MTPALRKRLERIEGTLGCHYSTVTRWPHETDADVRAKIDNWKAGEPHEDITGTYSGGDPLIVIIRAFEPPGRANYYDKKVPPRD